MTRRALPLAAILVSATACGNAAPSGAGFEVRDSAGIEIAHSASPIWGDADGWTIDVEPTLQLGAVEGDDPYLFSQVRDAARLPDGRILVVEGRAYEIRVFTPDGQHLTTFGGRGGGPREFEGPPFIAAAGADSVVTWDPGRYRLAWFDADGTLLGEHSLAEAVTEQRISRFVNGLVWQLRPDGTLLSTGPGSPDFGPGLRESTRRVILFDADDAAPHEFGSFPAGQTYYTQRADGGNMGIGNPFSPRTAVALGGEPAPVAIANSSRWEVQLHDGAGALRRIVRADIPRIALAGELLESERGRLPEVAQDMGLTLGQAEAAFGELPMPDSLPAISDMHSDAAGNLWIGRRTGREATSSAYDVIDTDGRWLGTVGMPSGLGRILEIGEDHLLVQWRDEMDVSYLRSYRIRKGAG